MLFFSFAQFIRITTNSLVLGKEANIEALNCLTALILTRITKFQLTTENPHLFSFCQQ